MTSNDAELLALKVGRYVMVHATDGERILGELVEVTGDGISLDVDPASEHPMAGVVLFIAFGDITADAETPRPLFKFFR